MSFWEQMFYNNSLLQWVIALMVAVVVLLVLRVARSLLARRLRLFAARTKTSLDDLVTEAVNRTKFWFLLLLAIKAATTVLVLPERLSFLINSAAIVGTLLQIGIWGNVLVGHLAGQYLRLEAGDEGDGTASKTALTFLGKLVLWVFVFLLILNNLDVDITALITGLGIGGIAVALAAQNILGDLFASLSILLDKPFVVGDFIVVGEVSGSVERIGLKTTRVRSISGEQVIFSNTDLLSSRIRNFKRMYERRILFTIGVTYSTPYDKVARIPAMIKEVVEAQKQARFDRAHFKGYGDSSLVYEVVFFVLAPDYLTYMDLQQAINLEIFRRFEAEDIEFAFPTRTIFMQRTGDAVSPPPSVGEEDLQDKPVGTGG